MAPRKPSPRGAPPALRPPLAAVHDLPDVGRRTDRIAEALKRYIVTQGLTPDTRLPPERQLAEVLMVGRNAVREAMHFKSPAWKRLERLVGPSGHAIG